MSPFDLLDPAPPGGASTPWDAYVELHNLLAAAAGPGDFSPADRVRISRAHGVDLAREFLDERRALYRDLLDERLANGDLDAEDRHLLDRVAATLALRAPDLRPVHERAFGTAVLDAVSDDCLSVEERLLLYKLQHLLGLDPRLADGAYDVLARERLLKTIAAALCDGVLTPEEDAEIDRVRAGLSLALPDAVEARLAAARERHRLLGGDLPTVRMPRALGDRETGRFLGRGSWATVDARWLERALGAKALRTGNTSGRTMPERAIRGKQVSGQIALSDRRLILRPDAGAAWDLPLDGVRQILRFRNGTVLRTHDDRRVYVDPGDRNEPFYTILYWLLFGDERRAPD